ncbi:ribosome silencing factor [Oceanibacterium hippocampi]|uniref:Ribosomal silencing factor RsfS n=1 Tax=Oceanibacterium hippocampi TaxID=745714 RepID=A0A1Y5RFB7_9PROT|nr:Ribosomal silencing factor RsfS [Oceanibacterium hippocampi]
MTSLTGVYPIPTANTQQATVRELHGLVLASLEDDKAEDVVSIDLSGKTSFADYMVIASGRSSRQVGAIADHLSRRVKEAGAGKPVLEGQSNCDWVLVDLGDVIVHIFRPEVRNFYALEKMWGADLPAEQAAV